MNQNKFDKIVQFYVCQKQLRLNRVFRSIYQNLHKYCLQKNS